MSLLLPHFIIGGERRCGTTSLIRNLAEHPQIFAHPKQDKSWFIEDSIRKKPDFSSWEKTHKIEKYSQWFIDENPPENKIIGEKSADYLFWRACHKRLAEHLPNTKFIFILRNPMKRAWSHYWNEVAKGREKLEFLDALRGEKERMKIDDYHHYNFSYSSRGAYSKSLKHFFRYIPQQNCLVLPVENIWRSPKQELKNICSFLGVDNSFKFPEKEKVFNSNWAVQLKPGFRKGFAHMLAEGYASGAEIFAKMIISNRNKRREALIKLKSPFYIAARDIQMSQEAQQILHDLFKNEKSQLQNLTGLNLDIWK